MRFLPIAVAQALLGIGTFLQKAGDRFFEWKGNTVFYSGRIVMVAGFLCLVSGLVVLWVDRIRHLFDKWR